VSRIRPGVLRIFRLPLRTVDHARDDADAELDTFLQERIDDLVRRGLSPEAAREQALARLGGSSGDARSALRRSAERRERHKRFREVVDELKEDVRFAWRQGMKAPAFTVVAVLTLALSIGANTAIFSVVHRLLLAPLPYPNGDRIVMPMQDGDPPLRLAAAPALVHEWRARTHTLSALAGASEFLFSVRPDGTVDTLPAAAITANFLPTLGVRPSVGRGFLSEEERADGQYAVALISHALWQRAYGGGTDVLGKTVTFEGRPLVIVGVTPPSLSIPLWRTPAPDLWLPATLEQASTGGSGALDPGPSVFALLGRGRSAESATAELQAIAASELDSVPREERVNGSAPVRVMRAQDLLSARERRVVQVLFAAVGALLLIACANLANLLLARAWARQREFAVRGALGAGRARIARQVLTESVSVALTGGLLGVGVAWLALRVIVALRPPTLDQLADVRLDHAVLLWCLGLSIVTGVLFGSAPALFAGAQSAGDVLRRESRWGSHGRTSGRVRSGLIVLEIAVSLVLLLGSGLLVRSFSELQRIRLGFEPRGLVYTDVLLGGGPFRDRRIAMRDAIVERLRALPGVTGVAVGVMPSKGYFSMGGLDAETDSAGHTTRIPTLGTVFITPDYFRVARIALVDGRLPDSSVAWPGGGPLGMSPEVLVNRELARRVWRRGRAIGARLREAPDGFPAGRAPTRWSTVVGVVDDVRMPDVRGDRAALQVYSLIPPRLGDVPFLVRTSMSADAAAPLVKHAIASAHPALFVRPTLSGDTYLRNGLAPTRFAMTLISAFAALALLLATIGLYSVIAYGVRQRTREIGVRVALGADPSAVLRLVIMGGVRLAGAGLVIGLGIALTAMRVIESMLYGVSSADPRTFGAGMLFVAAIALVASYVPARRALRIDPAESLRTE